MSIVFITPHPHANCVCEEGGILCFHVARPFGRPLRFGFCAGEGRCSGGISNKHFLLTFLVASAIQLQKKKKKKKKYVEICKQAWINSEGTDQTPQNAIYTVCRSFSSFKRINRQLNGIVQILGQVW